jgi:hypothetical protein
VQPATRATLGWCGGGTRTRGTARRRSRGRWPPRCRDWCHLGRCERAPRKRTEDCRFGVETPRSAPGYRQRAARCWAPCSSPLRTPCPTAATGRNSSAASRSRMTPCWRCVSTITSSKRMTAALLMAGLSVLVLVRHSRHSWIVRRWNSGETNCRWPPTCRDWCRLGECEQALRKQTAISQFGF